MATPAAPKSGGRASADGLGRLDAVAVIRSLAREARRCLKAWDGQTEGEALHDFRVAVRRLRAWLRAFEGDLRGAKTRKRRRRLGQLVSKTNATRDAQVHAAWLHRTIQASDTPAEVRDAAQRLLEGRVRLDLTRRGGSHSRIRPRARRCLKRLDRKLDTVKRKAAPRRNGHERYRKAVKATAQRLDQLLTHVERDDDHARAHAARLQGKRLRYLIEPVGGNAHLRQRLVNDLRRLQHRLGQLHDLHTLRQLVSVEPEARRGEAPDHEKGEALPAADAALAREIERQTHDRFDALRRSGLTHGWSDRVAAWLIPAPTEPHSANTG